MEASTQVKWSLRPCPAAELHSQGSFIIFIIIKHFKDITYKIRSWPPQHQKFIVLASFINWWVWNQCHVFSCEIYVPTPIITYHVFIFIFFIKTQSLKIYKNKKLDTWDTTFKELKGVENLCYELSMSNENQGKKVIIDSNITIHAWT